MEISEFENLLKEQFLLREKNMVKVGDENISLQNAFFFIRLIGIYATCLRDLFTQSWFFST